MLSRAEGATVDALSAALAWQPHTVRAALTPFGGRWKLLILRKLESHTLRFSELKRTLGPWNLVFLGIVFSAFQQRQASHREPRANRYRTLAIVSLSSFVVGIADVAAAAIELLLPATAVVTTPLVVVLFFAQLLGLVLLSVNATRSIS